MPRPKSTIPRYCVGQTGRAFTKVNGRFISLGRADDPESRVRYADILRRLAQGEPIGESQPASVPSAPPPRPTVNEVCLRFLTEYCKKYRTSSGKESAEVRCFKGILKILRGICGETTADDFGPLRLRTVRQAMIEAGWTRRYINKQVGRLRLLFRIAVSWEMLRADVLAAIDSVPPLARGESDAPERRVRRAVPRSDLDAVRAILRGRNRDLFDLHLLTCARPGELLRLTTGAIDRTGEVRRCELVEHKTAHQGKERMLLFNASAQLILNRYLHADPNVRLFKLRSDAFAATIKKACAKACVTRFVPHQLRHTVATRLADEVGTESAQRLLGHANDAMTEHYSRPAEKQAIEVVKKLG